jgi:hypothetical protein
VNGDVSDDLMTFDAGSDRFLVDLNRDGVADDTVSFGIPDYVERPVVGDVNLDGVDDLGLWVAGNADKIGGGRAEWYFLVSDCECHQAAHQASWEEDDLEDILRLMVEEHLAVDLHL